MKKILLSIAVAVAAFTLTAASDEPVDNLELSVEENLAVPAVPQKARGYVRSAMDQLRRYFSQDGIAATPVRDGEVLKVVIPCSNLFGPGAIELLPSAAGVLKPMGMVVRDPEKYKVLVTVHADDTGDTMYADSITAARANAIDDYLWQLASEKDTNVIPYGIGRDEPVGPNNSIAARAANRRVEIFIIPEAGMIRAAGVKVK